MKDQIYYLSFEKYQRSIAHWISRSNFPGFVDESLDLEIRLVEDRGDEALLES